MTIELPAGSHVSGSAQLADFLFDGRLGDCRIKAGLGRVRALLDEDVSMGRINALQAKDAMHRVAPTTEWNGLELADVAIEAVGRPATRRPSRPW